VILAFHAFRATNGSGQVPHGEGVAFAFTPFSSYEDMGFPWRPPGAVNPERSEPQGRVDGEDDRSRWLARERGAVWLVQVFPDAHLSFWRPGGLHL